MPKKIKPKQDVASPRIIIVNFKNNLYGLREFVIRFGPVAIKYDDIARSRLSDIRSGLGGILRSSFEDIRKESPKTARKIIPDGEISSAVDGILELVRDYDFGMISLAINEERLTN